MINEEVKWATSIMNVLTINDKEFINIPIDRRNYEDVFASNKLGSEFIRLFDQNKLYFDSKLHDSLTKEVDLDINISLYPSYDKTCYKIGYNISNIFNKLLSKANINSYLKDFDYTNDYSIDVFKKLLGETIADGYILDLFSKTDPDFYQNEFNVSIDILSNIYKNIDKLVDQMIKTNLAIDKYLEGQISFEKELKEKSKKLKISDKSLIIPKNLLMYSAAKSLGIFRETGDIDYYKYSKDYYNNVSNSKEHNPEWPKHMMVDGITYSHDYHTYNDVFDYVRGLSFPLLYIDLNIEDKKNFSFKSNHINSGQKRQVMNGNSYKPKRKNDYNKINKALGRKIKFYKGLKSKGIIDDINLKDLGYIGFVLDNNYVILDKFYELNRDGTIKRAATDNAVYVVTTDVLESCNYDRKKIRDYISHNHDFKAFRLYHNDKDSYQDRIKKVLTYKDVSIRKFEDLK